MKKEIDIEKIIKRVQSDADKKAIKYLNIMHKTMLGHMKSIDIFIDTLKKK